MRFLSLTPNLFVFLSQGLDKAIEETKYRMSRYSVTPNMLVIPPQLSLYMALAPEQKLTYPLAGPAGPAAFNAGKQGFEAQSFRGLGVFVSTPVCSTPFSLHSRTLYITLLFHCL